jgi:deazaflavin-dependent oxidoreductase (nitroreductase family)
MAYLKPNFIAIKIVNPLFMRVGLGGVQRLTVRGRKSGEPRSVAVVPVEHEGARYLVSARGETEWVRNLRAAAGRGELNGETFTSTEVRIEERSPIIEAYRKKAGRAVDRYWKQLPDPTGHPTFRIEAA